jgi:hypothetical protein
MMPPDPVPEETPPPSSPDPVTTAASLPAPPEYRWYHKAGGVLFVTFCVEIGFFLLIFPWTDNWDKFASFAARLRPYCDNLYVRGAISGLGIVNLYISLTEMIRLRRFAGR